MDRAQHKAVPFKRSKCHRQHALRDAIQVTLQLVKSLRSLAQRDDQKNAPLVTDAIQDLPSCAAFGVESSGEFSVP